MFYLVNICFNDRYEIMVSPSANRKEIQNELLGNFSPLHQSNENYYLIFKSNACHAPQKRHIIIERVETHTYRQ